MALHQSKKVEMRHKVMHMTFRKRQGSGNETDYQPHWMLHEDRSKNNTNLKPIRIEIKHGPELHTEVRDCGIEDRACILSSFPFLLQYKNNSNYAV